jgi:hypothetical protein
MEAWNIILGLILLIFGRKLFWLFVGIGGFLLGMEVGGTFLSSQAPWIRILISLGAGVFGALVAVVAQRVAFGLAGFYGGAYVALRMAQSLGAGGSEVIFFFVGGVLGAVFAILIMDWAIIVLSCLVGAGAIVEALDLGLTVTAILFLVLAVAGMAVQARLMHPPEKKAGPSPT